MKAMKVIQDPEVFQLLADQTRMKIVFHLRAKEMTVKQLAEELKVTPQAIYHHIKKLQKGDLVEVTREERHRHLIESYYRATAECFTCNVGKLPVSRKRAEEKVKTVMKELKRVGFNLDSDENKISELINVKRELDECCNIDEYEDRISNLDTLDVNTQQMMREFTKTLSMSDEQFVEQQTIRKKFRDLLLSLVKN
jgi:DNA-binding transcriptional ArsR family regulator